MEDVFTLLRFSYDNLDTELLRSCMLYCSLFPEDYCIEKEQLIEYWAGEGFFDCFQNGDPHIMGHAIIGSLKEACFLETGEEESQVKMHDVVRSFALWVASEYSSSIGNRFIMLASEGLVQPPRADSWKQAERISLMNNEITELSETPACPNLSTLLLQWNNGLTEIVHDYFKGMPVLKVLDLSFTSIKELPKSMCNLDEIRHLDLSGTKLRTLPIELGHLKKLNHLNMQRTPYLRMIPRDAISGLHNLKALNMYYSYSDWEKLELEGSNELRLKDLESMSSLDSLGITVTNTSALSQLSCSKYLRNCIQYMYIKECEGLRHLPLSSYPGDGDQLRRLSINNCEDLKYLAIEETSGDNWLPQLETLALHGLPKLTSIWQNRVGDGCLVNLRFVNIWYCHKLKNVSWILRLRQLETLYIFYCKEMEEVINEQDVMNQDYSDAFPKLKTISIRDVPELRSICQKAISFHCLKKISVIGCPKLRKLPLKAQNISELPTVYCYKEWWENLVWEDSETKSAFLPYFMTA